MLLISRVGPNHEKLSNQAPNWSKVVPWYKEQNETLRPLLLNYHKN